MRGRARFTMFSVALASLAGSLAMTDVEIGRFGREAAYSIVAIVIPAAAAQMDFSHKREQATFELKPGYSIEAKVGMRKGVRVDYDWSVSGGAVFFDKHGEREEGERSYATGRSSTGVTGVLEADFDGAHGWLWRNTGRDAVRITVRTTGEFNYLLTSPSTNR